MTVWEIDWGIGEVKEMTTFKYGEIVKLTGEAIIRLVSLGYDYAVTKRDNEFKVTGYSKYGEFAYLEFEGAYVGNVDFVHLIKTGKMIDFGKHPFKEYYLNGVEPKDLPPHAYKRRVLNFVQSFGYNFLHPHDLDFFWPNVEPDENDFIYCWPNAKAREKGRAGRTKIKPGKFFRMLFPDLKDTQIEEMVERFKTEFAPVECKVFSGSDSKDFLHAYTHERSADRNFDTSGSYKRMCDSCMRYERDYFGTPIHPVETYGTGDWIIFWAEDSAGRITARLLAYKGEDQLELGPIYATCQEGIDVLKDHIAGKDHSGIAQGDWGGARIIKVEQGGRFCGPYLDQGESFTESGKYLVVDSHGHIEHHHEGWFGGEFCEHCESHSSDVMYIESVGRTVCESCRGSAFFISDNSDEWVENCYHTEVLVAKRRYESWSEYEAECDAVFSEELGEYIHTSISQVTFDDEYIPVWYITEDKWFICTVEEVAYPIEEMVDTPEGPVAKCNYNEEEDAA